ncbi:hypothetical protein [Clostridium sp. DJ247]|nr:hypothetical protein [Clostridium sp. DJ247]
MIKNMTYEQYLQVLTASEPSNNCPVRKSLELFNGKWGEMYLS